MQTPTLAHIRARTRVQFTMSPEQCHRRGGGGGTYVRSAAGRLNESETLARALAKTDCLQNTLTPRRASHYVAERYRFGV